ncbi:Flp pilus assembly protein CpaB [Peredibacter starrii]|uniref:Flp pilus assembly protein CpaB n=1 Tax=Peredibacter starrii TaxID=28202 RepID=A0AAX4HQZ4_9BACT|nr:Flp pilus assembly protein CpaB [Peredibacter starrii]WPU65592.1 Flp pilus assembly protein CpaB [Peredibacter starrii]
MNSRAFTTSLILAAVAVLMIYSYISSRETELQSEYGQQTPVVVAKEDIKELEIIDDRKVQLINVPSKFQMPGNFKRVEDLYNTIAAVPIKKGEQITAPRVTYPGAQSGLSRQISIGKRALSIRVTEDSAVSRLLKPGDRVDVLALVDYASGKKERLKVKTVLQDVLVLSTGLFVTNSVPLVNLKSDNDTRQMKLNSYTNYNTVTLELTPFEVQKMVFLVSAGNGISLSLRNNDDKSIERISATRLYDVLGEDAAEAKTYFAEQMAKETKRTGPGGR